MAGLVHCRYCDYSTSARLMTEHERLCYRNPDAQVMQPSQSATPLSPGHVTNDHFRTQFDRGGSNMIAQLDAMAAHCSMLYNKLQDEKRLRLASYRDIVQRLSDANPLTELALSLEQAAQEMED